MHFNGKDEKMFHPNPANLFISCTIERCVHEAWLLMDHPHPCPQGDKMKLGNLSSNHEHCS